MGKLLESWSQLSLRLSNRFRLELVRWHLQFGE